MKLDYTDNTVFLSIPREVNWHLTTYLKDIMMRMLAWPVGIPSHQVHEIAYLPRSATGVDHYAHTGA
jgi:hypothetical protein